MGVKNGHARIHGETAVLAKKNIFLSVVTPTFVDGVFVAQCIHTYMMNNILPVGPITIYLFFSELEPF